MATNCLDVGSGESNNNLAAGPKHSTAYSYPWLDDSGNDSASDFFERYWSSQTASGSAESEDIAVTCHANDDGQSIFADGFTNFWNSVTPWQ